MVEDFDTFVRAMESRVPPSGGPRATPASISAYAGTRATGMRTGFQGDHGRGPACPISGLTQRHDLGMRTSYGLGGADAHNFPGWGHDDRAYRWIRARGSADLSTRGHCAQ